VPDGRRPIGGPASPRRRPWVAGAVLAALAGTSASGQVLQIGDDGVAAEVRPGSDVLTVAEEGLPTATDEWVDGPEPPAGALTELRAADVPAGFRTALEVAAAAARVSPELLAALVWQESRWRPASVSPKGARGLAQLMPGTARDLRVDPRDPDANLLGGARYLRQMLDLFDGDVERALAAYNAGPGRVRRARGVPPIRETRAYVASVVDRVTGTLEQGGRP
jgi:soluble lytic murein transglycosylase-like protein